MASAAPYHHGDLRNALLDAVEKIVEERGAANVSLREAARMAGVSHSAPAYHFGDKDGMLVAFCHVGFERLGMAMTEALAALGPDATPEERISAAGDTYVRFADAHRAYFDVMFRTGDLSIDKSTHDEYLDGGAFELLTAMVDDLVASDVLEQAHAQVFAVCLWSAAHGLASLWVDGAISAMFPDMTLDELLGAAFGDAQLLLRASTGATT